MNYIENINGCLTKYADTESAKKWIVRASVELSRDEFINFIKQLDELSILSNDKYASAIYSSIACANLSSLVTFVGGYSDSTRPKKIIAFLEEGDVVATQLARKSIERTIEFRQEQDRIKQKLYRVKEEQRRIEREKAEQEKQAAIQIAHDLKMREVAAENARKAKEAAEAAIKLNASRQFDLLLFDLDDTLVMSSHLDRFRGQINVGNRNHAYVDELIRETQNLIQLIPESTLLSIKKSFPDIKLGIFTRSPRCYAETLLAQCYPGIKWDCVVAYEDVEKTKPSPEGIFLAAKATCTANMNRIVLVGDEKSDLIAAYQAGAFSILYRKGWGLTWKDKENPKRSEHYRALELLPDVIVEMPDEIVRVITHPLGYLPSLESWDATWSESQPLRGMRVDMLNHFNNLSPKDGRNPEWVTTRVMGRYFATHHRGSQFDFRPKSMNHRLTLEIIAAKEGDEYPDSWIACCAKHISLLANSIGHLIVCPIPAKPGRPNRLERLVNRISDQLGNQNSATFNSQVLFFKEGVSSNKPLNQDDRFINIRDHLLVTDQLAVKGCNFLVIDDVTTTGATFFYADRYLKAAGAHNVHCLALAQTISSG